MLWNPCMLILNNSLPFEVCIAVFALISADCVTRILGGVCLQSTNAMLYCLFVWNRKAAHLKNTWLTGHLPKSHYLLDWMAFTGCGQISRCIIWQTDLHLFTTQVVLFFYLTWSPSLMQSVNVTFWYLDLWVWKQKTSTEKYCVWTTLKLSKEELNYKSLFYWGKFWWCKFSMLCQRPSS